MKKSTWFELMNNLGIDENELEFNKIQRAYNEKHRHYHNFAHIQDCLKKADALNETSSNYNLKLAIWYHDIVYNTLKKNNELKSAEIAVKFIDERKIDRKIKSKVHDLIMATIHQKEPSDIAEAYMMDIDISILGSSPESYNIYTQKIRKEYWLVPWFIYKKKRIEVMENFLLRKQIYFTEHYKELLEDQARENIHNEVNRLKKE